LKTYVSGQARWLNPHSVPPPNGAKINILQRGRTQVVGNWDWVSGHLAWSPLIEILEEDKAWIKENEARNDKNPTTL
jgi:hypothetical protein